MNKKQVESVAERYINFIVETPLYTSRALNTNEIEFFSEGLIKIKGKMGEPDVFIQIKDIKIVRGVGKL